MLALFPHWLSWFQYNWWPESGRGYAFWSSFGSCFAEITLIVGAWHVLNCHVPGCWRISLHHFKDPDTGETLKVCGHHHPKAPPKEHWWHRRQIHSLEHIHAAYARAEKKTKP